VVFLGYGLAKRPACIIGRSWSVFARVVSEPPFHHIDGAASIEHPAMVLARLGVDAAPSLP
jgi:hypothetical protein